MGTFCRKMLAKDRKKISSGFRKQKTLRGKQVPLPSSGSQKPHLWEQNLPPSMSVGHWFIRPMFIAHLLCAYRSHRNFLKGHMIYRVNQYITEYLNRGKG